MKRYTDASTTSGDGPMGRDVERWPGHVGIRDTPVAEPTPLPTMLDPTRIVVEHLAPTTAAQVVWYMGEADVLVSDLIPPGLVAAVVQHVTETHMRRCVWAECPQAREWLTMAHDALHESVVAQDKGA